MNDSLAERDFCSSRRGFAQSPQELGTFDRKSTKTRHLEFLLRLVVHPTASRRISHVA